jgi:hypothetical protein
MSQISDLNDTCDRCEKTEPGIGWFARGYRKMTIRRESRDPGNLCGKCAGSDTGKKIAAEILRDKG